MNSKHRSRRLRRYLRADEAVSALEYAMVVGLMAVVISAALVPFADHLEDALSRLGLTPGALTAGNVTTLQ